MYINSFVRAQVCLVTTDNEGTLKECISFMSPVDCPGTTLRAILPNTKMSKISTAYSDNAHKGPRKAATKPRITIVLAVQGANVIAKVASSLSRFVSIIRQARIAGQLQPNPRIMGISAL